LLSLDVKKGDHVMLVLPNLPQLVIAYFGALKAGAVPVFTANQPALIRIPSSGASILICDLFDTVTRSRHELNQAAPPIGTLFCPYCRLLAAGQAPGDRYV
jgi:acyl-CoA synthetase (AMP-forming)/AMP-acid ligase II